MRSRVVNDAKPHLIRPPPLLVVPADLVHLEPHGGLGSGYDSISRENVRQEATVFSNRGKHELGQARRAIETCRPRQTKGERGAEMERRWNDWEIAEHGPRREKKEQETRNTTRESDSDVEHQATLSSRASVDRRIAPSGLSNMNPVYLFEASNRFIAESPTSYIETATMDVQIPRTAPPRERHKTLR